MLTVYHRDTVRVAPSIVVRMAGRDILCGSWEFAPKRNGSAWQLFTPSALPEVLSLETEQRIAYAERVLALLMHVIYAQEKSVPPPALSIAACNAGISLAGSKPRRSFPQAISPAKKTRVKSAPE
jgi:hypothetical protein